MLKIKDIIQDLDLKKALVGTVPYIEIGDIDINTKEILEKQKPSVSGAVIAPSNSILISKVRPTRGAITLLRSEQVVSNAFAILIPKEGVCDIEYLFYILAWNNDFLSYLGSRATGATYPTVKLKEILEYEISNLPKISEQKEIAKTLKEAEGLKKQRFEADQKMSTLIPSIFNTMFDKVDWPIVNLHEVATVKIGPFGTQLHASDYTEGGVPLVNPTHIVNGQIKIDPKLTITENKIKELTQYVMKKGDVILGRRGEMGRCATVSEKEDGYLCGTGSIFIRPSEKISSLYLETILSSRSMKKQLEENARGVTMKNLNINIVEKLKIALPPIEFQKELSQRVEIVQGLLEYQKESTSHINTLLHSLISKYT